MYAYQLSMLYVKKHKNKDDINIQYLFDVILTVHRR